jgi:hypothetical protein
MRAEENKKEEKQIPFTLLSYTIFGKVENGVPVPRPTQCMGGA